MWYSGVCGLFCVSKSGGGKDARSTVSVGFCVDGERRDRPFSVHDGSVKVPTLMMMMMTMMMVMITVKKRGVVRVNWRRGVGGWR